jgi:hypothetical protein
LKLALETLPFLSVFVVLDGVQCVAAGICRGAGKQKIGAITSFVCYYFFGIPMAHFLCFTMDFNIKGLLMGISSGTLLQCLVFVYLLSWKSEYMYSPTIDMGHAARPTKSQYHGISFSSEVDPAAEVGAEDSNQCEIFRVPSSGSVRSSRFGSFSSTDTSASSSSHPGVGLGTSYGSFNTSSNLFAAMQQSSQQQQPPQGGTSASVGLSLSSSRQVVSPLESPRSPVTGGAAEEEDALLTTAI